MQTMQVTSISPVLEEPSNHLLLIVNHSALKEGQTDGKWSKMKMKKQLFSF